MKVQPTYKSILRYALILTAGIALILFSDYLGLFEGIDLYLYDLSFRMRGPIEVNENIIIAAIDEKTLASLGRWPVRRQYYAQLLASVGEARAVGMDIIMAEHSDDDAGLNAAINKHGRVVLPVYLGSGMNISYPSKMLSSAKTGHIHVEQGIDGVIRTVFHTIHFRDSILQSFASAIYDLSGDSRYYTRSREQSVSHSSAHIILQSDPMNINYAGPPGTFQQVSFLDVIMGKYPQSFFKDKVVLVGVTTPGLEERMLTPFTQQRDRMAGVEVHANILNSMLAGNDVRNVPVWMRWLGAVCISILFFFLFIRFNEWKATLLWALSLVLITGIIFTLFSGAHVWVNPTCIYAALTFVFLTAYVVRLEEMGKLLSMANDEWYRTFNDMKDAIIVHDCDFHILRANKAAEEIRNTVLFERITAKCREQFLGGAGRALPGPPQCKPETTFTMEMFDSVRNKHLEILTIPRLDKKNRLIGVIQIIRDITERKQAEESIRRSEEQLRNLAAYIQKVSEMERTNIAREIHDELGQALTVLKIDLSWIRKRLTHDQAAIIEKIDAMAKIIDKTIMTIKKISTDLRPGLLDDLGLSAAIEWQCEEFQKRTGIPCAVAIDPQDVSFDKDRNIALFRILQEALTNVARHADATEVNVSLQAKDSQIELRVRDNGKGISEGELAGPQSFGLMGMRERAIMFGGNAEIQGVPGRGTIVTVKIPVENMREHI